jgi:hypothetical protein
VGRKFAQAWYLIQVLTTTPLETWVLEKALSHQLYLLLICTGKLDKTNAAFDKVKELLLPVLTTTPKWTKVLESPELPTNLLDMMKDLPCKTG